MKTQMFTDMPDEVYHSDPFDDITLSSSMAATFITDTPAHVYMNSSRLNPDYLRTSSAAMDKGTILDKLILEGENVAVLLDFDDYRTKAAKEARDAAADEGKIPMLKKDWPEIETIRKRLFEQLDEHEEHSDALRGGIFQPSIFFDDNGVACRSRFDHVNPETGWIDDLKTTAKNIDQWIKDLFSDAKDIQSVMYSRAYEAWKGERPKGFRYVVQQVKPPYLLAVVVLDTYAIERAELKLQHAKRLWLNCLISGKWQGYPPRTIHAFPPTWVDMRFDEKVSEYEAMKQETPEPEKPAKELLITHHGV